MHTRFVEAFELLADQPGIGRTRAELTGARVRWWNVFQWIVIYDPTHALMSVLRVIHGARAIDQILHADEGI